jgi:hypothetical protein
LTSSIAAVSLLETLGNRMIQPFAIISLLSLIIIVIVGLIVGDDEKGLVMA